LGVEPQYPLIRQSTMSDYQLCPRYFMLKHRFGLRAIRGKRSSALTIGTFVHQLLAGHFMGEPDQRTVERCGLLIEERRQALEQDTSPLVDPDADLRKMEQELALARTMVDCYRELHPHNPRYSVLMVEKTLRAHVKGVAAPLEGTVDLVIQDHEKGGVWIPDFKTTNARSCPPLVRAATTSFEDQPQHYRILVNEAVEMPVLGSVHIILAKPPLVFGKEDRPYEWYNFTPSRGKNKGVTRKEKRYLSETPSYDVYLRRVRDWLLGEGDYAIEAVDRQTNPMIAEVWNSFGSTPIISAEYREKLIEMGRASRCNTRLERFPRYKKGCFMYRRVCEYLGLCQTNPRGWRPIVAAQYEAVPLTVGETDGTQEP